MEPLIDSTQLTLDLKFTLRIRYQNTQGHALCHKHLW